MSLSKCLLWGRKAKIKKVKGFINWFIRRYYACEINCDTQIDESVRFPHNGLGVMINNNCIIGKNVSIFPGAKLVVTKGKYNAPIIEDNVIIGANATLIGKIIVGGSIIGAGAVVTKDVPKDSTVVGINIIYSSNPETNQILHENN